MLVHFRETPYGLAMSLVESRRENGKVRHEHLASLGSIETPPSVDARIEFGWHGELYVIDGADEHGRKSDDGGEQRSSRSRQKPTVKVVFVQAKGGSC